MLNHYRLTAAVHLTFASFNLDGAWSAFLGMVEDMQAFNHLADGSSSSGASSFKGAVDIHMAGKHLAAKEFNYAPLHVDDADEVGNPSSGKDLEASLGMDFIQEKEGMD